MERFGSQVVALKNGMEFNSMAILYVRMRPCFSGVAHISAADDQTVLGLGDMVMLLLMMMIGNGQHGIGQSHSGREVSAVNYVYDWDGSTRVIWAGQ